MKIQNLIVNHEHNIHPLNPKLGGGGGGGGWGWAILENCQTEGGKIKVLGGGGVTGSRGWYFQQVAAFP